MVAQVSFILLPQIAGNGYYSFSSTDRQYGTQTTIDTIVEIARSLFWNQRFPIGVGDMSFVDGHHMPPHISHKDGKCMDLRPLRKDRFNSPVNIAAAEYDHDATDLLARALLAHRNVAKILFNDATIAGVTHWAGHDNHLHVVTKS